MIKNGLYNVAIGLSGPLINLVTIPAATSALGVQSFGEASVAISIASYFTIVTSLGLAVYGTRELAQCKSQAEQTSKLFSELLTLSTLASAIGTVLYVALSILGLNSSSEIVFIGAFSILINFLNIEWLFYAHENYKTIAHRTLFARVLGLALVLAFVDGPDDLALYVSATLLAQGIPFLFVFTKYKNYTKFNPQGMSIQRHLNQITSFLGIRAFSSIYTTLDIAIVGLTTSTTGAGFYAVAIRVARIVSTTVCSMTAVSLPRAAELIALDDKEKYNTLLAETFIFTVLLSSSALVSVQLLADPIIIFLGGIEYIEATKALEILACMIPIVALSNFTGMQILYPQKKEKTVALSLAIGSITCIFSMPPLIEAHGISGASASILAAESSILLAQALSSKQALVRIYRQERLRINRFMFVTVVWGTSVLLLKSFFLKSSLNHSSSIICIALTMVALGIYALGILVIKDPLIKKLSGARGL